MFFRSRKEDRPAAAASGAPGESASPGRATVSMTVNGKSVSAEIDARTLLVQMLRASTRAFSATDSAVCALRSMMPISAPSWASRSAMARPTPWPAPVGDFA